jgi:hypothetical protein
MTELIITSVIEEIDEWQNRYGDFMYSVTAFAGRETVRANRKDRDRALELQGLLKEAIGEPREYVLEDAGTSKNGNPKWKLIGFGKAGQNGASNGHGASIDGRAIALQAAAVWAQGREWDVFETAFQRMYALLAGITAETVEEGSSNGQG